MKIKKLLFPLNDAVVVKLHDADSKTEGGLIIPGTAQQRNLATVLAVGPGLRTTDGTLIPPSVKPQDVVLLVDPSVGKEFTWAGADLLCITESNIIGTVQEQQIE